MEGAKMKMIEKEANGRSKAQNEALRQNRKKRWNKKAPPAAAASPPSLIDSWSKKLSAESDEWLLRAADLEDELEEKARMPARVAAEEDELRRGAPFGPPTLQDGAAHQPKRLSFNNMVHGLPLCDGPFDISTAHFQGNHVAIQWFSSALECSRVGQIMTSTRNMWMVALYGTVQDDARGRWGCVYELLPDGSLHAAFHKIRAAATAEIRAAASKQVLLWDLCVLRLNLAVQVARCVRAMRCQGAAHCGISSHSLFVHLHGGIHNQVDVRLGALQYCCQLDTHTPPSIANIPAALWYTLAPELLQLLLQQQQEEGGDHDNVEAADVLGAQDMEKADIYALGIVFWDILTLGSACPYSHLPGCETNDISAASFPGIIAGTLRPLVPENCHPGLAELMQECWQSNAQQRPSADDAVKRLAVMWWEAQQAAADVAAACRGG